MQCGWGQDNNARFNEWPKSDHVSIAGSVCEVYVSTMLGTGGTVNEVDLGFRFSSEGSKNWNVRQ